MSRHLKGKVISFRDDGLELPLRDLRGSSDLIGSDSIIRSNDRNVIPLLG
jgi:hypothetical protein